MFHRKLLGLLLAYAVFLIRQSRRQNHADLAGGVSLPRPTGLGHRYEPRVAFTAAKEIALN
jgi:hypothetical protein